MLRFKAKLSRENARLPQLFFVDSSGPCKELPFPRGPTLAQKPLNLVGTVLRASKFSHERLSGNASP